MRSLIILEVEHGEDTDGLTSEIEFITDRLSGNSKNSVHLNEYTVRIDLPECFVLSESSPRTDFR